MVWMVTMIGWTFGIPDSIMGITFLAAGTSVPDAYASMHAAKMVILVWLVSSINFSLFENNRDMPIWPLVIQLVQMFLIF